MVRLFVAVTLAFVTFAFEAATAFVIVAFGILAFDRDFFGFGGSATTIAFAEADSVDLLLLLRFVFVRFVGFDAALVLLSSSIPKIALRSCESSPLL